MFPRAFTFALALCSHFVGAKTHQTPNIVLFMVDDMGIGDCSAYLGLKLMPSSSPLTQTLKTPNIEEFAQDGMIFTDAHAPASMCSSTRYSLLTGRLSHRSYLKNQGWLPHGPNRPMIQRALTTLPEMLQRNGYRTCAIGKYHVGMDFDDGYGVPADEFDFQDVDFSKPILDGPTHHGFDEFFGVPGNTEDPLDTEPRIYLRDDRWTFTDRSQMKLIGMKQRSGRILADPNWDLSQLGPDYLREAKAFVSRQAQGESPFFLYYVPNSNHLQQNPSGPYAVPDSIANIPIKGKSVYTNGVKAGDREDMVLENDVAFGALLKTLRETEDPRRPGYKLIDNTIIIFTSDNGPNVGDNFGVNRESGGLRGKKAKLWEGGHRVPFILYWKDHFEGKRINRNLFSLTDLFATMASLLGDSLNPMEAQDSLDSLAYWKKPEKSDARPRYFFCHLGPPFENDALAIRKSYTKIIIRGGLAQPWTSGGAQGSSRKIIRYDLNENLLESEGLSEDTENEEEISSIGELLKIHNQGFSRDLNLAKGQALIIDDGWHNLRNDLNGKIGFDFELLEDKKVTHLGMWDDHDREKPTRPARGIATEDQSDLPSRSGKNPRNLSGNHLVSLWTLSGERPLSLAEVDFGPENKGVLEGEFRYIKLERTVNLKTGLRYRLTMSTQANDGDHFHDPVSFDGLSPLTHPLVRIIRSIYLRNGNSVQPEMVPAFSDLHPDYSSHRLPVGPTLKFLKP